MNKIQRAVLMSILCSAVFTGQALAENNLLQFSGGIVNNKDMIVSYMENIDIEADHAIINEGSLEFRGESLYIGNTSSLFDREELDYINHASVDNSGKLYINTQTLDIDNHYGMSIKNTGEMVISSSNYFIGTDFCCSEHSNVEGPSDRHAENPARHTIIDNSGFLKISGGLINDNESAQVIQGKIIHRAGAITQIDLYGSNNPYDLCYQIEEMVNFRNIAVSAFMGTVEGSSDNGFSIALNSGAVWMAGKQSEKVNSLSLNGGAIVVGNLNLSAIESYFGPEITLNANNAWPDSYNTLYVSQFNSDGNFRYSINSGNFDKTEGIYVFTDLKNNQGDRIVFTGSTPDKSIPLGIINNNDNDGLPITPSEGHKVTVVTAPANTKMDFQAKMLVYGNELAKLYGRSLQVQPFTVYQPTLEIEYKDGSVDGIDGQSKNWVFTGWSETGSKSVVSELKQQENDPNINIIDIDNTLKRLNDIRTDPSEVGVWIRGERGKTKISSYGYEYSLTSGGYDWIHENDNANVFAGVGISYSQNDCDTGIIGDTKSLGFNLYGSWYGKKNHDYVDVIVKYGRLDKDYAGYDINGVFVSGDYDKDLFSIAAKYGRRFAQRNGWYYEPFAGLTWGRVGSADFVDSQNVRIHADSTTSKIAMLGMQVGTNVKGMEYYGKVEVRHDFDGKMHVSAPDSTLPGAHAYEDMGGTWCKLAVGASRKINSNNSFYLDLEKDFGNKVKKPYAVSFGYRYTW